MHWAKVNLRSKIKQQCILCAGKDTSGTGICQACIADLARSRYRCPKCALPLTYSTEANCSRCQQKPPTYQQCFSCLDYDFPISQLLSQIKHNNHPEWIPALATLMSNQPPPSEITQNAQLIPVPMHRTQLNERGFNQAEILSRHLSKATGITTNCNIVKKVKNTQKQKELSSTQRKRNLAGAFESKPIDGGTFIIIDDVMTTGATVNELTRTLLNQGADRVYIWVLARTPAAFWPHNS